jgi:hypothetical protein
MDGVAGVRSLQSVLVVAAAAAFGVLTWSMAHLLTSVLYAHAHSVAIPHAHVGEGSGRLMIAMVAFLTTLIASVSIAARSPRPPRTRLARRSSSAAAAAAGPAAFVAIEWAAHLGAGHEERPIALVVVGALVHATMGAATPLLWNGFVRRAILRLPTSLPAAPGASADLPTRGPDQAWLPSRTPSETSSRGPPAYEIARPCAV